MGRIVLNFDTTLKFQGWPKQLSIRFVKKAKGNGYLMGNVISSNVSAAFEKISIDMTSHILFYHETYRVCIVTVRIIDINLQSNTYSFLTL